MFFVAMYVQILETGQEGFYLNSLFFYMLRNMFNEDFIYTFFFPCI